MTEKSLRDRAPLQSLGPAPALTCAYLCEPREVSVTSRLLNHRTLQNRTASKAACRRTLWARGPGRPQQQLRQATLSPAVTQRGSRSPRGCARASLVRMGNSVPLSHGPPLTCVWLVATPVDRREKILSSTAAGTIKTSLSFIVPLWCDFFSLWESVLCMSNILEFTLFHTSERPCPAVNPSHTSGSVFKWPACFLKCE